jgi:hypothetical protein
MISARLVGACVLMFTARLAAAQNVSVPIPEPLEPDRPDITNGTHIVGTGLLQIEFGGVFTRDNSRSRSFGSPITARLGVLEWLELRVGSDGLLTQTDETGDASGIGNTQLGAKLRLWADPGGVPVVSFLPTVNLPTADAGRGLGSGSADYTIAVLTGTDLGRHAHVDVNYGIGAIGTGKDHPHFTQHLASVSFSDAVSDNWNPYVEAYRFSRQDIDAGAVAAIDAGAIYQIGARYALDGGIQFGLTSDAPGFAVFGGLSFIVGDVFGSHGAEARQRHAQARAARSSTKK